MGLGLKKEKTSYPLPIKGGVARHLLTYINYFLYAFAIRFRF
jgi:hypothetical protein